MEKLKIEITDEEGKSIIKKLLQGSFNEIMIRGKIDGGDTENYNKISINLALWVDNWSLNILYKLFWIIQDEIALINNFKECKDVFSCFCNLILQEFYSDFKVEKNIEKFIEKKIKKLEKFTYGSPKKLSKTFSLIDEELLEEISLDKVMDLILSLRKQRLIIYNTLLSDFEKNEKYLDNMKKQNYKYV